MLRANEKRLHLGGRLQDVFSGPRMGVAAEIMADSPVVYCPLLETSGSSCDQRGSSGVAATATGTRYVRTANGIVLSGYVGQDYVSVGDAASNRLPGDMTLEAIVLAMRDSLDASGVTLFAKGADAIGNPGYVLRLMQDGSLQILKSGVAVLASSNQTNLWDGKLHQVAVTRSGNTFTFYVDGISVGGGTSATAVGATTRAWDIGRASDNATSGQGWPGIISHAAIYASALSQTRLKAHWQSFVQPSLGKSEYGTYDSLVAADHPALWLRLDEAAGNFVNRGWLAQSATPHGTITRAVATSRSIGNGITFGGTIADYLQFPGAALDMGAMFTYEFWAKVGVISAASTLLGKSQDSGTLRGASLQLLSNRHTELDKWAAVNILGSVGTIPNDGLFHHVVFTREGSNNSGAGTAWYFDGVASNSGVNGTLLQQCQDDFYIGAQHDGVAGTISAPYPGSMAQVAVYNYALTSGQIYQHWLAGQ